MSTPNGQQPLTLEEAEQTVAIYSALEALKKDKNYQLVFEKFLFQDEVIRLHGLLAHPDSSMIDSRDGIIGDLDALSNIKFSLKLISRTGSATKDKLDEFRAAQFEAENEMVGE